MPGRQRPSDFKELQFKSLLEVAALLKNRDISSVELTQSLLKRIESPDGRQKSYATVMADRALAAAEQADQELAERKYRGPLHGIPIAVKDLCFTKGTRTMGGAAVLADHIPNEDATVVTRLAEAGAVLLGKLNLTEGAMGGYHPHFEIPLNPGIWACGRELPPADQGLLPRQDWPMGPWEATRAGPSASRLPPVGSWA